MNPFMHPMSIGGMAIAQQQFSTQDSKKKNKLIGIKNNNIVFNIQN